MSDKELIVPNGVNVGVFGSNTKRAKDSWLNVRNNNPGPGSYDTATLMHKPDISFVVTGKRHSTNSSLSYFPAGDTTLSKERSMTNAVFRSTVGRFSGVSFATKKNSMPMLQNKARPRNKMMARSEQGKFIYDSYAVFGAEDQIKRLKE